MAEWIDVTKLNQLKFYNSLGNRGSKKLIKQALKFKHEN